MRRQLRAVSMAALSFGGLSRVVVAGGGEAWEGSLNEISRIGGHTTRPH